MGRNKFSIRKRYIMLMFLDLSFHSGYNYDYHFIIKEFAEEFKNQFTC